jgi:hypothetical protein
VSEPTKDLSDEAVSTNRQTHLSGTYEVRVMAAKPGYVSFGYYRRTYRVFSQDRHLMIQAWGSPAEPLLMQKNGTFSVASFPSSIITFPRKDGEQWLSLTPFYIDVAVQGRRIGPGDAKSFQSLAHSNDRSKATRPSQQH